MAYCRHSSAGRGRQEKKKLSAAGKAKAKAKLKAELKAKAKAEAKAKAIVKAKALAAPRRPPKTTSRGFDLVSLYELVLLKKNTPPIRESNVDVLSTLTNMRRSLEYEFRREEILDRNLLGFCRRLLVSVASMYCIESFWVYCAMSATGCCRQRPRRPGLRRERRSTRRAVGARAARRHRSSHRRAKREGRCVQTGTTADTHVFNRPFRKPEWRGSLFSLSR